MGSSNHRANADAQIAAPISKKCSSSSPSLYSTSAKIQLNMKAVTPLRRSTRICRQTPKAIGSSPESATEVSSISSRQKLYSSSRSQTYSDSTLCDITSSESSGSSTEDSVSYPANPTSRVAVFPPEVCETYDRLAPILRYSDAELGELDIPSLDATHDQISALLQHVNSIGYSRRWPEFNRFLELCERIVNAKERSLAQRTMRQGEIDFKGVPGLEFAAGSSWVAMDAEYLQDRPVDTQYLQGIYRDAMDPGRFSWDDVGAVGSEEQPEYNNYSTAYSPPPSHNYLAYPDTTHLFQN